MKALLIDLRAVVGETYVVPAPEEGCVRVRPAGTEQVAAVLAVARRHRVPVVPEGGRTGLVYGTQPLGPSLLLSLDRLNAIAEIDTASMTVTAQAGVILQTLQEAVEAHGLTLPLDIGARGSATVGGVVSTNAGGLRAVKWGVTRDMVLGLEAVLADGQVVSGLRKLLKDNAGYDWKQLMIGSEGTLGIVTAAVFRLRPRAAAPLTALLACDGFDRALALLRRLEGGIGLTSFELSWRSLYDFVTTAPAWRHRAPLPPGHALYALVEAEGGPFAAERLEAALQALMAEGIVTDGVVAQSAAQAADIWATRDDLSPVGAVGPILPYDVSVPIARMGELADGVAADIAARFPDARLFTFGHAGDGNLHFVVAPGADRMADAPAVDDTIFARVAALGGSVSAEHGVGLKRRDAIRWCRSPAEIALMRTLKQALDPAGLLNPGKVVQWSEP